MKRSIATVAAAFLFTVLIGTSHYAKADMAETAAGTTEARPVDPNVKDLRTKKADEAKVKVVEIKDVKPWGKVLAPLASALKKLKEDDLDKEEFQDYEDFYLRTMAFVKILEEGEKPLSGRARGYLFVMISAYIELEKSPGFIEDTTNNFADNRTKNAKSLKVAIDDMRKYLLGDGKNGQIVVVNGQDKINVASNDSIVKNFSESLVGITNEVTSEIISTQIDPEFEGSEFKKGLLWMLNAVKYVQTLKGGDGSKVMDSWTQKIINFYDTFAKKPENLGGKNFFEDYMHKFEAAAKASKDRKAKFMDLAGKMEHLDAIFVTIKNHVQYGVGYNNRTYIDLVNDLEAENK